MVVQVNQGLKVEQVADYARVSKTSLKPKDHNNLTRSDLRTIQRELAEGLENVPNNNADYGEAGLAVVVCDKKTWNDMESARLATELVVRTANWEIGRDRAATNRILVAWDAKNPKPVLGTPTPYPRPPKNPGPFTPNSEASAEDKNISMYNHLKAEAEYLTYRSADTYAVALIKDEEVLGKAIFSNMPGQGKRATALQLLEHVRKRFDTLTAKEIVTLHQKFWSQPKPGSNLTDYFARQQRIKEELEDSKNPVEEDSLLIAGEGHISGFKDLQRSTLK